MSVLSRVRGIWVALRTPMDASTAAGRSQARNARIALTAASLAASSGTNILVGLISVPIALSYLGAERYGLWLSITSMIALLRFADLGIGNGLVNSLAEAHSDSDASKGRRYVSSGFFLLLSLGLGGLGVFAVIYPFIDWGRAFAVTSSLARAEVGPTVLVLVACVGLNLPIGAVQRIQTAHQVEYIANAWTISGSIIGLVGTIVCAYLRAPLPWLVVSVTGSAVLVGIANSVYEFWRRSPDLRPLLSDFSRKTARGLFQVGLLFVMIQITGIALVACDNLILSHLLGPESVPLYAVPLRLFQIAPILVAFALKPIWPAYAEARTRGDAAWILLTFRRSVWLTLGTSLPFAIALVLLGPWIVATWVGTGAMPPPERSLLVPLAIWSVLASLGGAFAMFMNGMDLVRFQAFAGIATAALAITAKITLTKWLGVPGVVWGMVIPHSLFLLAASFAIRRRLARQRETSS